MRSKKKLKQIARIYAAILVNTSTETGASSCLLTNEEHEIWVNEVRAIAEKLGKNLPMNIGELDGIIQYVDKNNQQ